MSKAEERALEMYPMKDYNREPNYLHTCDSKMLDEVYREVFRIGYELAEKDLALTVEDIKTVVHLYSIVCEECKLGTLGEIYEEVLRRFNKAKGK